MNWQSELMGFLSASLVRPPALAAIAWMFLRFGPGRHPASRHAVWTAVLIGMLVMPFLSLLTPHWDLAVLPAKHEATIPLRPDVSSDIAVAADAPAAPAHGPVQRRREISFEAVVANLYFAGLLAMLIYRVMGWAFLRRVISRSRPVRARWLRESDDVLAPFAAGVLRPAVILPGAWRDWDPNMRRAVLAHEIAHLRRHDALVSALARFAKCVFWFHPLAWYLSRQLSNLAELACDAVALQKVDDPGLYSRILLQFAGAVNRAGYRVALPGLAMAASSDISRRIDQVFELCNETPRKLARPALLLGLIGAPLVCLAATVGVSEELRLPSLPAPRMPIAPPQLVAQAQTPQRAPVTPAPANPVPQTAPAPTPKFDVVSVRPCTPNPPGIGGRGGIASRSPGTLNAGCIPLEAIIRTAYVMYPDGVNRNPNFIYVSVEGGPAWIKSELYQIDAKTEGTQATAMMQGPMLQAVLEDRFKVKIHRETRQVPVYELTVAKSGFKLEPLKEGDCTPFDPNNPPVPRPDQASPEEIRAAMAKLCGSTMFRMPAPDGAMTATFGGVTLDEFARSLGRATDRPIFDKTGIAGLFNIRLEFTVDQTTPAFLPGGTLRGNGPRVPAPQAALPNAPAGPSILTAIQEELGLKLEPARGPGEFLVIDHAEKPSEN